MFKNTKELSDFVSVQKTIPFSLFQTALPFAELSAEKLVSSPVFAKLRNGVFEAKWEQEYSELLTLVKRFVAFQVLKESFVDIRNQPSAHGLQQTYTDSEGTSRPATVEDAKMWVQTYNKRAFQVADQILAFLEKNMHAFEAWTFSESFTEDTSLFVRRTADFTEYFAQVKSRQVYLEMRSFLKNCEKLVIKPFLGNVLYADLKSFVQAKLKNEGLSSFPIEAYEGLIEAIKPVCVYFAVEKALVNLPISFEADGLYLNTYKSFSSTKQTVDYRATEAAKQSAANDYQLYLQQFREYLADNQLVLPKLPEDKKAKPQKMPDNSGFKSGFIM